MKWSDIDRAADTVTIARSRVLVDGQVIKKSPKSKRSWRTLPLFSQLTGAIQRSTRGPAAPRPEPAGPQRRPGDRAIRYK
jgi:hypothetical protein